jgi:methanogenic corrinoid protein MtbC1
VYSGEILKQISDQVKPEIQGAGTIRKLEKEVLGTISGEIHDIGLNIVDFRLDVNGFEVINLGVDVPALKFVDKIKESGASIIALSGFLTLVFDSRKEIMNAIE